MCLAAHGIPFPPPTRMCLPPFIPAAEMMHVISGNGTPIWTSFMPILNGQSVCATRKSHAIAMQHPPATQCPLSTAYYGTGEKLINSYLSLLTLAHTLALLYFFHVSPFSVSALPTLCLVRSSSRIHTVGAGHAYSRTRTRWKSPTFRRYGCPSLDVS